MIKKQNKIPSIKPKCENKNAKQITQELSRCVLVSNNLLACWTIWFYSFFYQNVTSKKKINLSGVNITSLFGLVIAKPSQYQKSTPF